MSRYWKSILIWSACFVLAVAYYGVRAQAIVPLDEKLYRLTENLAPLEIQTKKSQCIFSDHGLPDPACTPGDIFTHVTKEDICTPGYSASMRNVSQATKEKMYRSYGITHREPGEYKIDHLISLQLGGSNAEANLWPKAAEPRPGFHEKDEVENYLHEKLCNDTLTLPQVQYLISKKWLEVYTIIHE